MNKVKKDYATHIETRLMHTLSLVLVPNFLESLINNH